MELCPQTIENAVPDPNFFSDSLKKGR